MPGSYEVGVWKRNYIENIKTLQIMYPKVSNNKWFFLSNF